HGFTYSSICITMLRILVCLNLVLHCLRCEFITVKTSRGSVQGFDHDLGSDTTQRFYGYGQVFLGIPFAKPPLGERRFALPEDICHYNDRGEVHNATYFRPRCWQVRGSDDNMDEDCLYLNVMTPDVCGKYPVLVYIHGGTFTTGSVDKYHWKGVIRNLVSRGIVVVTIQYRLAMLGFFTTFTERFPPNRGLFDQIAALHWVNEEIGNFGGDTSRITIYGQSAGATSVSELSISPLARGLFHQVIQSSGSSMQQLEIIDDPRNTTVHKPRVQQICSIDSSNWGSPAKDEAIMKCLLKASPEELVAFDFSGDAKVYNAVIDGAFLPDYPENLAKSRPNYPTLIGDMLEEVAMFVPGVPTGDLSLIARPMNEFYVNAAWPNYDDATIRNLSDTMIDMYAKGDVPADDDHLGWATLITEMNTGLVFTSMMLRDAHWQQQAGNNNLWLFTFSHRSLLNNFIVDGWIPIPHASELPYVWFFPHIWETYDASESDMAVAENMGFIWAQFVKTGELPFASAGNAMNYVEIEDSLSFRKGWRKEADEVYNEIFPAYLDNNFPPVKMTDETWNNLRTLGKKVLTKWNSMRKCSSSPEASALIRTRGASALSCLKIVMIMILISL
ncbi:hypothetical protein PENTCL1PPCAC_8429, partial [Pristionchus entomophagus]